MKTLLNWFRKLFNMTDEALNGGAYDSKEQLRQDSEAFGRGKLGAEYLAGYAREVDHDEVAAVRIDGEAVILGNYQKLYEALAATENPEANLGRDT